MFAAPPIETPTIAFIGDSPRITSGFGTCNRMAIQALMDAGYNVIAQTWLDSTFRKFDPFHLINVAPNDPLGREHLFHFLEQVQPDVIFIHCDPGNMYDRYQKVRMVAGAIPVVAWYPIEGQPLHPNFADVAANLQFGMTYCESAADAVEKASAGRKVVVKQATADHPAVVEDVPPIRPVVQRLGWDHAPFRVFPREVRDHLRAATGIGDAFLVMNVGVNKRGNRQPTIIKASKLAQDEGRNIVYYLHTAARGGIGVQGWDLPSLIKHYGTEHVILRDDGREQYLGVAYDDNTSDAEYLAIPISDDPKVREDLFHALDLIAKLNIADLYIDPSSVQGWNLPTCEAAACGLPVITVDDGLARSEVFRELAADWFKPDGVDDWHSGSELMLVSAAQIHKKVCRMEEKSRKRPGQYAALRAHSRKVAEESLKWNMTPLLETVAAAVAEAERLEQERLAKAASPVLLVKV